MLEISADPAILLCLPRLMLEQRRDVLYSGTATPWESFSFARWGTTPSNERTSLCIPILSEIEEEMLRLRPHRGGRYFVTLEGAFYKDEDKQAHWFVTFCLADFY